jgi:hypothetical protein
MDYAGMSKTSDVQAKRGLLAGITIGTFIVAFAYTFLICAMTGFSEGKINFEAFAELGLYFAVPGSLFIMVCGILYSKSARAAAERAERYRDKLGDGRATH